LEGFEEWWNSLDADEQDSVDRIVQLLIRFGPTLDHPYTSSIASSRHGQMRELRIQHKGRPYRVLYAFVPRRSGVLLLGGDKTGRDRWYEESVPVADDRYDAHVAALTREGLLKK
jgi:hypothetical protein